jgi:hypothetical protein
MDLMNNGSLNDVSVEYDKSKELVKFLDAGKFEGFYSIWLLIFSRLA